MMMMMMMIKYLFITVTTHVVTRLAKYVEPNIESRSCIHCCRAKAV